MGKQISYLFFVFALFPFSPFFLYTSAGNQQIAHFEYICLRCVSLALQIFNLRVLIIEISMKLLI